MALSSFHPEEAKEWFNSILPKPVKWKGWEGVTNCPLPSHGGPDHRPSFTVNAEKGVWKCFTEDLGGNLQELARRLGKNPPEFLSRGPANPERVFEYQDESGKVLYQVLRFPGKKFFQRRPDGEGGWIQNLKGVPRVPYRLPELIQGMKAGEAIFVTEGEKDAESLRKLGLVATCNSGGAGKWIDDHSKWFERGTQVIVCPDADKPGEKHARRLAESLSARGCQVKVLDFGFPKETYHGKDVTDWLSEGGSKDRLLEMVKSCLPFSQNSPEEDKLTRLIGPARPGKSKKVEVLGGLFPRGYVSEIFADPGAGKTWLALRLALDMANGGPIFEGLAFEKNPLKVLFAEGDIGKDLLDERLLLLGTDPSEGLNFLYLSDAAEADVELSLSTPGGRRNWEAIFERIRPDVVFIDTLTAFHESEENDATAMKTILHFLRDCGKRYQMAVVVIHHARKTKRSETGLPQTLHDSAGSGLFSRIAGVILGLESKAEEGTEKTSCVVRCLKSWVAPFETFGFSIERIEGEDGAEEVRLNYNPFPMGSSLKSQQVEESILREFVTRGTEGFTRGEVLQGPGKGVSERTVDRCLGNLLKKGRLNRSGFGPASVYYIPGKGLLALPKEGK
jgi:5S rRNA maturation endonuclease (ribonuclease M5)/KaiC/GvpD/RAD55 family RecA-like ATPase